MVGWAQHSSVCSLSSASLFEMRAKSASVKQFKGKRQIPHHILLNDITSHSIRNLGNSMKSGGPTGKSGNVWQSERAGR
jgi:hypothetical protein